MSAGTAGSEVIVEHRVTGARVGVLGATSLVGECLLPRLSQAGWRVVAFSRQPRDAAAGVKWCRLPAQAGNEAISAWVCVAPIWVLPDYFPLLEASGARRVVALSSTSRFTKLDSNDVAEVEIASCLIEGEQRFTEWAEHKGVQWLLLRPTLIYGLGRDRNIAEMARFIRRFHFFPVLGKAQGLRQPIHADDVAQLCVAALGKSQVSHRAFDICGGETLTYRAMVERVFAALGRSPRVVTVPLWAFRAAVALLRILPRYRHWSVAMAERMNCDLVFDSSDARRELGVMTRPFQPSREDASGLTQEVAS